MAVSLTPAISQRARGRWSALRATFIVSHRPDRNPVDIERLTPKRHRFSDYGLDHYPGEPVGLRA